jgi:NADH dehydrogenase
MPDLKKRVVIVGGGFGGLAAAKKLGGRQDLSVVLLDRRNHHLFQPLLYQVATAGLNSGDIAIPIRTVLAPYKNIEVFLTQVEHIDLARREVTIDAATIPYDYLILACGAQHSYFGHENWETYAPGLKTLEQAIEIRRRMLTAFELAEREKDPARIKQLLTFAIVGGGPTGVELAGAIGEIIRYTLSKDFRHIDPKEAQVVLVEAGPRILASFDEKLSLRAARDLEKIGVTIWTNTKVTQIDREGIEYDAKRLMASTVLWAAGVQPSPLNKLLQTPLDRAGRVIVEPDLSLPGHPEVFVIGDQAACLEKTGETVRTLPGLAPVAMQQGRYVAGLIRRPDAPRKAFHYQDKGQMATIGRRKAVAQTKTLQFGGVLAWYAWILIHIFYLIGFKNRVVVLIEWAWSYTTFKRGAQLITNREWRSFSDAPEVPAQNPIPATQRR